ncbi:Enzymatic polyprotein [Eumeta japonica]|uniref:Enzymatic polyprotein n=1 Tax=Eumeta variegata TaxID=151549 RepID=A0A4C1TP36_EUMVA|nr:Enzymatic polyprotein [Eumeta japonica]
MVLTHIAKFNEHDQRLAFTSDVENKNQLQRKLRAMSFLKRKIGSERNAGEEKRFKSMTSSQPVECYRCDKLADTEPMEIKLKDPNKTVCCRHYRMSPWENEIIREKIKDLLTANVIRPSCSPFVSPIIVVKKKDGIDRMFVDYRELNDNTIPDRFQLLLISDQINHLYGAHFFTSLDMANGFHQIREAVSSIECTTFVTPDAQYKYSTSPCGLRKALSVFQAITKALGDLANSYVVIYVDDILVVGFDVEPGSE